MIQTTIGIDGMMCSMCEAHVNDAIRRGFDVKSVRSDRKRKRCVVVSEEPLDEARVAEVIAQTGYELLSLDSEPYRKRGLRGLFSR
jgi:copper chaperone CopZ